ncbi:ubiquitin fusion degradation protein UFD1-domain-containing protein [Pelagophyceae sp. CCMP2097]|nr:ubiquitin fusion degradation protein UFD1-domain-containing protein [Pelagophyceae sp. CCMP2097]
MLFGRHSNQSFDEQYHCFSGAFADKNHLEEGDKILLPSSAFEQLARLQIEYPMLFELRSTKGRTHCGVLEFTAPEGNCYLPFWMMQNLMLEEGGVLSVKNVSLPKATFVKFKPQSTDFLEISNPRAVLERALRMFSCVTQGDQICLPYNDKRYYLEVVEVKPSLAACIIECDCNVDFDAPVGYTEPVYTPRAVSEAAAAAAALPDLPAPQKALKEAIDDGPDFKAFAGSGQRLDGKQLKETQAAKLEDMPAPKRNAVADAWANKGGMKLTDDSADVKRAAAAAAPAAAPQPAPAPRPTGPAPSKWAKNNRAAFTGSGHSLK